MPGLSRGLVQVYTGEGKGKTTAALGLVLRAAGWGLRAYIAQFLKHGPSGEREALARLAPLVTLERFGRPGFLRLGELTAEDRALAEEGFARAREALVGGAYDLVILDEINTALAFGLLSEQAVLDLIAARPAQVELVLTGRGATPGILAAADLVTRMVEEKHPYQRGISARRGIEY
jgi:cob(I)alamin adenosyltransferase